MKFNESTSNKMQLAAAPLQQEPQARARPNRAARRSTASANNATCVGNPSLLLAPGRNGNSRVPTLQIPDRILRLPEVLAMVGIGRTSVLAMVAAQEFPAPLKLTARIRGWRLSAIEAFLASKEAE
ncbi:helix-turn-helix transcriptional regulator [Paraburkholderia dilworthii]|uniref:helix-turn-helix transcriptional regulator n=1 Tax=Paraburkholderia dilworthii TaxID=948106 RepID=UPI000A01534B|nr:AlpA family phage regulatory protein [Paraburkholderia dilworthii]